jgi:NAD(P)-dependent dehydrogenase (short-subunit alcohol dehydrogenase family)
MVAQETALVLGNSDGIGLAITKQLLERGFRVVGLSRSPSPVASERYEHTVVDVTAPAFSSALQNVIAGLPRIHHVIYCVGVGGRASLENLEQDVRVFDVNLMAALRCAAILLPRLHAWGGGRFIVLSSQADGIINPEAPSYTASKAALSLYFEGLGLKLRRTGVQICNVRFGFVETKMARAGIQPFRISTDEAALRVIRLLSGRIPLRVTYPRRARLFVLPIAWIQRARVALARGPRG